MSNKTEAMKKVILAKAENDPAFDHLQKCRRDLQSAFMRLYDAHKKIQTDKHVAADMSRGDVISLCGIPHPNSLASSKHWPKKT